MYNNAEQGLTSGEAISHESWFLRTSSFITNNNLPSHVQRLSYALVIVFLTWSIIQAAVVGSSKNLKEIFLRLIIVGAVFSMLSPIQNALYSTWRESLNWSSATNQKVLNEVADKSNQVSILLAPVGGMISALQLAGTRLGVNAVVKATAKNASNKIAMLMRTTTILLMPIIAMYSVVIYSTGLIVLLSMLFLPLAAAFLMISNGSWLWKWLSAYLAAIFIVLFVPIVFGIAADLAIVEPLNNLADFLDKSEKHFITAMNGFTPPTGAEAWNPNEWRKWSEGLGDSLWKLIQGIWSAVIGWIIALIMMFFGIFAGVYLMLKMPSYIGSYLGSSPTGSFVGGAASLAGAGFLSARLKNTTVAQVVTKSLPKEAGSKRD